MTFVIRLIGFNAEDMIDFSVSQRYAALQPYEPRGDDLMDLAAARNEYKTVRVQGR